jgi:hypothetical protein
MAESGPLMLGRREAGVANSRTQVPKQKNIVLIDELGEGRARTDRGPCASRRRQLPPAPANVVPPAAACLPLNAAPRAPWAPPEKFPHDTPC